MMRSLYSGVAGMRSQQMLMDVIGNNIANVGTVGYKASRVTFEDTLNEMIKTGSDRTNPLQVGTGVRVGAVSTLYSQGSMQATGHTLDLGIAGKGFLVMQSGEDRYYTRATSLSFSKDGYLVHTATGNKVLGWQADNAGNIRIGARLQTLQAQAGESSPAAASTAVDFTGVLDARLADGEVVARDITVIDSIGRSHVYVLNFTRVDQSNWDWQMSDEAGNLVAGAGGTITFDADGSVDVGGTANITAALDDRAENLALTLDFTALEQLGGSSSVTGAQIGGVAAGTLRDVVVDEFGVMSGVFSNGTTRVLGQLALATFTNQEGLMRVGSNIFAETTSSGAADTVAGAGDGRGKFTPGSLEMSNVDLSQEFVSMIVSQRAFQANSRIVTTTDEILQEVVNLKR